MPRKNPPPSTKIIRTLTGKSDPLLEKAANILIKRYRKNRAMGANNFDALTLALGDIVAAVTGRRPPRVTFVRVPARPPAPRPARPKPAKPREESDEEIMARLKAELDRRNAARSRP
jgi:hypothetical protein